MVLLLLYRYAKDVDDEEKQKKTTKPNRRIWMTSTNIQSNGRKKYAEEVGHGI